MTKVRSINESSCNEFNHNKLTKEGHMRKILASLVCCLAFFGIVSLGACLAPT